ncbi:MAG: hypothetical protein ACJ788_04615 [Ktedonobacteraceae bacterium]
MSKKRREKHQSRREHQASVVGRSSLAPFCAYYENGITCQVTTGLCEVLIIAGPPRLIYMACPAHYEVVHQVAEEFLLRCQATPQTIAFETQERRTCVVTVHGSLKTSLC